MGQIRNLINGQWVDGDSTYALVDAFTGEPSVEVHQPSRQQVREGVRAVARHQEQSRLTPYDRYQILARASQLVLDRRLELVEAIVADTGFTLADSHREVDRSSQTLLLSGEEGKRLAGEVIPVNADPTAPARLAMTLHWPIGVVCAITPFNSPLNTVCHKIAPALAGGNGVVLKPAKQTPQAAKLLVEILLEAGLPEGLLSFLNGSGETTGQWLLEDEVPGFYAFTGSTKVGDHILRTIGARRSQMELGSLSSTLIFADADLASVAALCSNAGFRKAGQVCTSVQRLYVEEGAVDEFSALLLAALDNKEAGDPRQPSTFIGPVIDESAAQRVTAWVSDAAEGGAKVLAGGPNLGSLVPPTVLTDVDLTMTVMSKEIFGPVVVIRPFADANEAVDEANSTPYGLAAGICTSDIGRALSLARRLRFGVVHINETSSARVDLMPFGGVKASGFGKEGPAYAIREMTYETTLTMGPA